MTDLKGPGSLVQQLRQNAEAIRQDAVSKAAALSVLDASDGEFGFSQGAQDLAHARRVSGQDGNHADSVLARETLNEEKQRKRREDAAHIHSILCNHLDDYIGDALDDAGKIAGAVQQKWWDLDTAVGDAQRGIWKIEEKYEQAGTPLLTTERLALAGHGVGGEKSLVYKNENGTGYYVRDADGKRVDLDAGANARIDAFLAKNPNVPFVFGNDPKIAPADLKTLNDDYKKYNTELRDAVDSAHIDAGKIAIHEKLFDLDWEMKHTTVTPERAQQIEQQVDYLKQQQLELKKLDDELTTGKANGTITSERIAEIQDQASKILVDMEQRVKTTQQPVSNAEYWIGRNKEKIAHDLENYSKQTFGQTMPEEAFRAVAKSYNIQDKDIPALKAALAQTSAAGHIPGGTPATTTQTSSASAPAPRPNPDLEKWTAQGPDVVQQFREGGGIANLDEVKQVAEELGISPQIVERGFRDAGISIVEPGWPPPVADRVEFAQVATEQTADATLAAAAPTPTNPAPQPTGRGSPSMG